MKPDIEAVIGQVSQAMAQSFAPQAANPYLGSQIFMSSMILGMAVEEADRAAHRRAEENRAIRGLFQRSAGLGLDGELAARVAELAAGEDSDLRVSALEAGNSVLRAALIDLHAAVEARADPAARALNAAIWAELALSTERRRFAGASF